MRIANFKEDILQQIEKNIGCKLLYTNEQNQKENGFLAVNLIDYIYSTLTNEELLNRPNAIYGINVGALKGGEKDPSEFFKVVGQTSADGAIIMHFDFVAHQPDLQFECISFYCTVIRACSDILS